ncbi:myeloid-associated differentiation marker-like protein 2 [Stegastes partitus]|uniref:Myeloid-associated differentiation marker-like protein 2 n=1 Tax=Stegastes partitus TaxID=144197 RepID=A0A3B5A9P8_9TELE|nr:PREDICTED: myeloid-associated differentiation marker-like protein 2 [Stegastes partitus]XP_008278497.1 PREDICTED: myeloid-associated differentiation marker-like protein 2 [Stegastes partitus]
MDPQGGPYLNRKALLSPLGAARLCQLAMGCAVIAMVTHSAGYSGSHGIFCMAAWCFCFAMTVLVFFLDATRLYSYLPVSWDNLTVTCAAFATLLYVTASVVYPLFFVRSECPYAGCEVRDFRIAVAVCSILGTLAYGAEVVLCRARPGQIVVGYMATVSGLLKVVQGFVACIIFGSLANGSQYSHYAATIYCVAVYAFSFTLTAVVVIMTVCRRTKAVRCMPFDRFVVVCTLLKVLLYLSASVIWPVFCFDAKYGSPWRPSSCPRGKCPWDSKLVVAVFSFVNFGLYLTDLIYSQKTRFVSSPVSANARV